MTARKGYRRLARGVLPALVAVLALSQASAQDGNSVPNALQGFSKNRDQPVQIEAASLEVRDKQKIATFSGNVKVVQGDTTVRCKTLIVHYDDRGATGSTMTSTLGTRGRQQISRLEAKGGVIVTQHDQTATGDLGLFDMRANTVTLTGNVVVSQGQNVMRGDRLVVNLTTGVSRLDAGKSQGPVRMLIQQQPQGGSSPSVPRFGRPPASN
jgi:lipopolysaccharide export system protein LptA